MKFETQFETCNVIMSITPVEEETKLNLIFLPKYFQNYLRIFRRYLVITQKSDLIPVTGIFFIIKQNKKIQKVTDKFQLAHFVCLFACMMSLTSRYVDSFISSGKVDKNTIHKSKGKEKCRKNQRGEMFSTFVL